MSKILEGKVISTKMQKTAIVEVVRKVPHPLYKKLMKRNKKYKVDTGNFNLNSGETVKIIETRPISKDKYFKVLEVISVKKLAGEKKPEIKEEIKKAEITKPEVIKESQAEKPKRRVKKAKKE